MRNFLFIVSLFCFNQLLAFQKDSIPTNINYGEKGWELTHGENYKMNVQLRFQFRAVYISSDSTFFINEEDNAKSSFNIQRARIKIGGHAFKPYLNYYLEYDFPSNNLLNFELTYSKYEWLQLKVGQWKINYNTERYISSGKQQLADRSIANRYFTLDRQMGVALKGNVFTNKIGSSSYNLGVFNGSGIGTKNENGNVLLFARYQWNFSKTIAKSYFSDLQTLQKPEGFVAFSYVNNQSAYTNFSSSGGSELPGYPAGSKSQYQITQLAMELFFKYKGFSLTNENHVKNVLDVVQNSESTLYGGYIMTGYFMHQTVHFIPKDLEFVVRYAQVQNTSLFNHSINEYSSGFNWFFNEHRNKLTLDFSYIENNDFDPDQDTYHLRLQWDISF